MNFDTAINLPEVFILLMLSAGGFLLGLLVEKKFGRNRSVRRKCRDLSAINERLKRQVEQFERERQSLANSKINRSFWNSFIQDNNFSESLFYFLLESITRKTRRILFQQGSGANSAVRSYNSNQLMFDTMVGNEPEILALLDLQGTIVHYNEKLMAIYGVPVYQHLEKANIAQILTPESGAQAMKNIAAAPVDGCNALTRYEIKASRSRFASLLVSYEISLHYIDSAASFVAKIARPDIVIHPPKAVHETKCPANLGELLQKDLICLSAENRVIYLSPAIAELMGEPAERILGKPLDTFINQRDIENLGEFLYTCQAGRNSDIELEMAPHKPARLALQFAAYPSLSERGEYLGSTMVVEDVTRIKQVEDRLQHRLAIEQLISSISNRFMTVKTENIDQEILNVLKQVCEFENARDCTVDIRISSQFRKHLSFSVSNEDMAEQIKLRGKTLKMDDYETVSVPIVIESETVGHLKFCREKYKDIWLRSDITMIVLIGEIIINAMIRSENELHLRLNEKSPGYNPAFDR